MQQENLIATDVLNICFDIYKQYGPGLFEKVYEDIICYELTEKGNKVQKAQYRLFMIE